MLDKTKEPDAYDGPNAEKLVKVALKIKKARAELAAKFKQDDAPLEADLKAIEAQMLKFLNATGQKTATTAFGQFYWQTKIAPRADDWSAFYQWIAANDAFDALQKRIKVTFISEYMEAHKNDKDDDGNSLPNLPPGISVLKEREICIRNPNT